MTNIAVGGFRPAHFIIFIKLLEIRHEENDYTIYIPP